MRIFCKLGVPHSDTSGIFFGVHPQFTRDGKERDLEAGAPMAFLGFTGVGVGRLGLLHMGHGSRKMEESGTTPSTCCVSASAPV